jgi:lipid II isoglutaminyl synthase (glutamine-hydrolysing)
MMIIFPLILAKTFIFFSRLLGIGNGSTWPGEIILYFFPKAFEYFAVQITNNLIFVAGTNGKTTTAKMIRNIILKNGFEEKDLVYNDSGANLLNGLVSACIKKSTIFGKLNVKYVVFEIDEATLPIVINNLKKISSKNLNQKFIFVFLNLFRDQLDRYGEVDTIANKWKSILKDLPKNSTLILNADDPQIAYLGIDQVIKCVYFGIDKPEKFLLKSEHATDSTYCLSCGHKLIYKGIYFSHIGLWDCPYCHLKRPKIDISGWQSPIQGFYNEYNTLAAAGACLSAGFSKKNIENALKDFVPAFGRMEVFTVNNKRVKILLSKNPAGFNVSLKEVIDQKAKTILLVLNDRIPDGTDVSWIWDVDFEMISQNIKIIVSGERVYDMALRIKYSLNNQMMIVDPDLKNAINFGLSDVNDNETLFILATYSAMLEVRKILTGRKIL